MKDRRRSAIALLLGSFVWGSLALGSLACGGDDSPTEPPTVDRLASIPADVVKGTPENDPYPPILYSDEFLPPVPVPVIDTRGAEDSPFIPAGTETMYFFFAADVRLPPSVQIQDPVNGIWVSQRVGGQWSEPSLVWLQDPGVPALNGCEFVEGDEMLFCTARAGFTGVRWYRATFAGGRWTDWRPADFPADYDVGELHIHDDELYYGSDRTGGKGGLDIWMLTRRDGEWADPVNIAAVNSPADDSRPYVTPDGQELWITRTYLGTPAIFRSTRLGGEWQPPEMVLSQFAGEPTLDGEGNLYFVHHYYRDGVMIEADIYVAERK